jgi:hypothetical protein
MMEDGASGLDDVTKTTMEAFAEWVLDGRPRRVSGPAGSQNRASRPP